MTQNRTTDYSIAFVDLEVGIQDRRIHDVGAVRGDGAEFHSSDVRGLIPFLGGVTTICGHNVVRHDMRFLQPIMGNRKFTLIDTLHWSPLLFPERPYHALLKDDKLLQDELNNPLSDAKKAQRLYEDEVAAFLALEDDILGIFESLLCGVSEFDGLTVGNNVVEPLFVSNKCYCGTVNAHRKLCCKLQIKSGFVGVDPFESF